VEQVGGKTVYYDEAPLMIDNYRPYAQNMQDKRGACLRVRGDR
jgi:hypothetical protein